jgi:hypothetical protein
MARLVDVIRALDRLPADLERDLDARVGGLRRLIDGSARLRDDLEFAIEEVDDDDLRRRLRRNVTALDELLEELAARAAGLSAYDLFDPIRVLAANLRLDGGQQPLAAV